MWHPCRYRDMNVASMSYREARAGDRRELPGRMRQLRSGTTTTPPLKIVSRPMPDRAPPTRCARRITVLPSRCCRGAAGLRAVGPDRDHDQLLVTELAEPGVGLRDPGLLVDRERDGVVGVLGHRVGPGSASGHQGAGDGPGHGESAAAGQ